jgi:transposase
LPFHAIPHGSAGSGLIAMLVFENYGQHQPLSRQAEHLAHDGIELSLSIVADLVRHATGAVHPIHGEIEDHVLAAHCPHGDDTAVPLLARGGAKKAGLWTFFHNDDWPWNGGTVGSVR